jgi:hypothetical protein
MMPGPGDPCPGFLAEPGLAHGLQLAVASHPLRRFAVMDRAMVLAEGRPLVAGVGMPGAPRRVDRTSPVGMSSR